MNLGQSIRGNNPSTVIAPFRVSIAHQLVLLVVTTARLRPSPDRFKSRNRLVAFPDFATLELIDKPIRIDWITGSWFQVSDL